MDAEHSTVELGVVTHMELSLEGRMRESDVGSPSADTGRAISDHRISRPGLIWRRGSQSLMGNFEGSNRSSRWHWHQPRKGRCSDTDDHLLAWQQGLLGILCRMERQDRQKPTSPRCVRCGEQPKFAASMLDPPTGRTFQMFECVCGARTWISEKM